MAIMSDQYYRGYQCGILRGVQLVLAGMLDERSSSPTLKDDWGGAEQIKEAARHISSACKALKEAQSILIDKDAA